MKEARTLSLAVEQITTWQAKALSVKRFTPGSDVLGAYSVLPVWRRPFDRQLSIYSKSSSSEGLFYTLVIGYCP